MSYKTCQTPDMPNYGATDRVRRAATRLYVEPARRKHLKRITIHSGTINKQLVEANLLSSNRLPIVCNALKSTKFLKENHLVLEEVQGPPSGRSSTVTFVYRLDKGLTPQKPIKKTQGLLSLYGVFRGVYDDLGGVETFINKQRDEFDREGF